MNSIKKNLIFQTITQFGGKGLMFLVYMIAARMLGPDLFGLFDYTNSYIQIAGGIFFDLGLILIVTRDVSSGKTSVLGPALLLKIAGSVIGCFIIIIISRFAALPFVLMIFLTIFTICGSFINLYTAVFRARNMMHGETIIILLQRTVLLLLLIIIYYGFFSFENGSALTVCGLMFCASAIIGLAASIFIARRYFPGIIKFSSFKKNSDKIKMLFRESLPMIGVSVFWLIYFKIDIILLGLLSTKEQVGLYSAAYRIMEASFIIPMIVTNAVYPKLSDSWVNDKSRFIKLFRNTAFALLSIGFFTGAALLLIDNRIIGILLGSEYASAWDIFVILIIAVIIVYPGQLMAHTLVIIKRQMNFLWISIIAAAINISMNIILIPLWQAKAAALSTIVTELAVGCSALFIILRYYNKEKGNENRH